MAKEHNKGLSRHFDHQNVEDKWYEHWMSKGYFHSEPDDREPYTIVIPPPNVTGVLHMGHMLNNTIQDVLIRRARMQGYNACWVPGTDHASIATEAKVVAKLAEEGIRKKDIDRETFLKHAFDWKEKYGGIILEQLKKLGASCDWERTRFTMEDSLSRAVVRSFVHLYRKGWIYQGVRMTNWDPVARTALSGEEVKYEEVDSSLYYISYPLADDPETSISIATTRPETILGDTAVCVHPEDERFRAFHGRKVLVPLINRAIPVICDEYVDPEFGTGALKITPAHDENDHEIGKRHNLESIDILNEDGSLSESAGLYVGMDRFDVRVQITEDLKREGFLGKVEHLRNKVGFSERTNAVVEPRLTHQWFLKMEELSAPALKNVMNDNIRFFPPRYKKLYRHWLEHIRDWCISRQLWWGQRIPAYHLADGSVYVAESPEEALELARKDKGDASLQMSDLRQDEDVVDTWFSSWLWPISVFDGFDSEEEVSYYYPTKVLVTAWDIIFFWVARMIFAGYEFRGERPFDHVYFTGMVRDRQRRKMSKSLGNSPDALELIREYGADGVRVGILMSAPAGNDLLFDIKYCEQGRNFSNKIWNALKLIRSWEITDGSRPDLEPAFHWMDAKLNSTIERMDQAFTEYRLSEALMTLYSFVWDDFCSWYLEIVKPEYGQPVDQATLGRTIDYFKEITALLHPFMPFLTEEVFHHLHEEAPDEDLIVRAYPVAAAYDQVAIEKGERIKAAVTAIRDLRIQHQLKQKEPLEVRLDASDKMDYEGTFPIISKLAHLSSLEWVKEDPEGCVSLLLGKDKLFVRLEKTIDAEAERTRIMEEIRYLRGFVASVDKKLDNQRFVSNAPPAVVDKERKKKQDGEEKIKMLEENLANLGA